LNAQGPGTQTEDDAYVGKKIQTNSSNTLSTTKPPPSAGVKPLQMPMQGVAAAVKPKLLPRPGAGVSPNTGAVAKKQLNAQTGGDDLEHDLEVERRTVDPTNTLGTNQLNTGLKKPPTPSADLRNKPVLGCRCRQSPNNKSRDSMYQLTRLMSRLVGLFMAVATTMSMAQALLPIGPVAPPARVGLALTGSLIAHSYVSGYLACQAFCQGTVGCRGYTYYAHPAVKSNCSARADPLAEVAEPSAVSCRMPCRVLNLPQPIRDALTAPRPPLKYLPPPVAAASTPIRKDAKK
jgi:hypothetical protein